ncbi:hypothetical protein F5877DRAFT_48065 [Lentinula edodes]|nr:hypothetical protein F5877DRAFT_48065 [Lentinula edodes]
MATWLTAFALIFLSLVEHSSTVEQKPLSSVSQSLHSAHSELQDWSNDHEYWDVNKPSADNSTANLVFSTASSLLQSIPNSRYRNGHTIIPGIVQSGTMLYHGRGDSDIPTMDWVAFEPELSYTFCRIFGGAENCWLHNFVVDRPLRVLYFDGSGTALAAFPRGSMDSQDIFAWGEIKPDMALNEGSRIRKMCEWASKLGLDGFIRQVFQLIMLCDFGSVKLVSSQHLKSTPSTSTYMPAPSGPMKIPSYTVPITTFDAIQTLKLLGPFDYYPGLSVVQLDLTHFVSFYDTTLAPSLIAVRSGKPRLAHRLLGIDEDDIVRVRKYLEEQIAETPWSSLQPEAVEHGIDWSAYLHSIISLYGKPLEDIWVIINSTWPQSDVQPNNQDTQVKTAFRLIEYTVQRFILYSVSPVGNASDFAWASPVYKECALSHTSSISTTSRTKSEALLRNAVEGTTRELCRVLTKMWAMGVHEGLSSLFDSPVSSAHPLVRNAVLDAWKLELGNLIQWLDWNVWIRCKPACGEQELCHIPNFPFSVGDVSLPVWREDDPKPRCLRTVPPYIYIDDH